jgi:hypothetical protein
VFLALVMWAPFGFHTSGLVEEWGLLGYHDRGEQMWWLTADNPLASLRLRPIFDFPFELAYTLGHGFVWLNVIALLLFVGAGVATYLLVERIAPGRRAVAVVAGALAMFYPVNEGLFTFRVIHIRMAVVLFLLALVLLCDLARWPRWWKFGAMSFLLAASLLMYQIAAAALVLGPVVVALSIGIHYRRALLRYSAAWFAAPIAVGCYWLWIAHQGGAYELESVSAPRPSAGEYADDLVDAFGDQLFGGWKPLTWVSWEPRYVVLGVLCGFVVAVVARVVGGSGRLTTRSTLLLGLAAIILSPLGFLPLWTLANSIHEKLKVYLLSSVTIAIGVALVLGFVSRRVEVFALVGGILVGLAVIYGLHQHAHYVALAHGQVRVLGQIVEELPSPKDGSTIVVRDHSGQFSQIYTLGPAINFSWALTAAYDNPSLNIVLCNELTGEAHENGRPIRTCPDGRQSPSGPPAGPTLHVPPHGLAVFDYEPVNEMRLVQRRSGTLPAGYAPQALTGRGKPTREGFFACSPIERCTAPPSALWPRGAIHESIGPDSTNVTGFRPSEKSPEGAFFRWSIAPRTHVYAFLPERQAELDAHVLYLIDPAVKDTIRLRVNGRPVPIRVEELPGLYRLRSTIPAAALRPSPDDIELTSAVRGIPGSPERLGIAVTSVDVTPS